MYRVIEGNTANLADVEKFLDLLRSLDPSPPVSFFNPNEELFVTRAPGRLDVMGGIADYSGSLMLELPIAEATLVALQRSEDRLVRIVSLPPDDDESTLKFEMPLTDFEKAGTCVSYQHANQYF